jgi:hypothetical protein
MWVSIAHSEGTLSSLGVSLTNDCRPIYRIGALGNWQIDYREKLTNRLGVKLVASYSVNLRQQFWRLKIVTGEHLRQFQPHKWGALFATVIIGIARSKISKQVMDGYCPQKTVSWPPAKPKTVAAAIGSKRQEILGQMQYFLCLNWSAVSGSMPSLLIVQFWQPEGDR